MLCGIEANDSPHFVVPRFDLMMDFVTSAFQASMDSLEENDSHFRN